MLAAVTRTRGKQQGNGANGVKSRTDHENSEHENVDSEATLETRPVKALAVEEIRNGNGAVMSDHVVSLKPEHPATHAVIQRARRAAKTLPEIVDPPPIIAPEFHPGSVFVARISSSWKNLAALVIVVLIACGMAMFALPQIVGVLTGGQKEAVTNTADLPAASNNLVTQAEQSTSSQIETPSAAPVEITTEAPSKAIEVTPGNSKSIESTRQSQPDGAQQKALAARTDKPESVPYPRSRNRISKSLTTNRGLSVATAVSRPSASARKPETVPATAKLKQQASDPEAKPAPLSVEVSRSRTVLSTPPSSANESSGSQSAPLGITPGKSKTKVIPWP